MVARSKPASRSSIREWVGGSFDLPAKVTIGSRVTDLAIAVWCELPSLVVVGHEVAETAEALEALVTAYRKATESPMVGRPRRPQRIRVASDAQAEAIRAAVGPGVEVVVGETPELREVGEALRARARDELVAQGIAGPASPSQTG